VSAINPVRTADTTRANTTRATYTTPASTRSGGAAKADRRAAQARRNTAGRGWRENQIHGTANRVGGSEGSVPEVSHQIYGTAQHQRDPQEPATRHRRSGHLLLRRQTSSHGDRRKFWLADHRFSRTKQRQEL
jgi:hypothetical protein